MAQKARLEIDEVIGFDRLPNWQDQQRLPYCRALLKELNRWAPIAIAGVPHETTHEIIYDKYTIPANTILIPNIPALSRNRERYDSPDVFDPRRFIGDDKDAAASARCPDYGSRDHFQFGFGKRFCPGSYVAEGSLYMAVSRIIWGFEIHNIKGQDLNMNEQRYSNS
ncbi:unnamed protein product [Clonostachys rosea]|uniref:Cytochrome P450 n=1 Tax=Bionectria ochroleuca TaxID=29856 RepID=A0ABY6UFJ0_BIOOC|nr:unnamed protein product [Clonostachys rosea]